MEEWKALPPPTFATRFMYAPFVSLMTRYFSSLGSFITLPSCRGANYNRKFVISDEDSSLNSASGLESNRSRSTNQIAPIQNENTHGTRYTAGAVSLSANHVASYKGDRSPLH